MSTNETQVNIPRMETIKKTAEIFGLPVRLVRTKVNNGEVVAIKSGKRFLVNVDKFAEYLNTNTITQSPVSDSGAVKPIPTKLR